MEVKGSSEKEARTWFVLENFYKSAEQAESNELSDQMTPTYTNVY